MWADVYHYRCCCLCCFCCCRMLRFLPARQLLLQLLLMLLVSLHLMSTAIAGIITHSCVVVPPTLKVPSLVNRGRFLNCG